MSDDFVPVPPTNAIEDPQVRAVLDAVVQNARIAGDLYLDAKKVRSAAAQVVRDIFGGGGGAGAGAPGAASSNIAQEIDDAINAISKEITNSLLYQTLTSSIDINSMPLLQNALQRLGAGVETVKKTSTTKDLALASAVNNIWASIGGSAAVISDSTLASATPTSATATRWNSVTAALRDSATGTVTSTSIVNETRSYADAVNGKFNSIYTVRAVASSGGQTVIGGFGLASSTSSGGTSGPGSLGTSIDFGVLANKFFIGAPTSGYNPATEYTANPTFPFIVVTTTTTIDGKSFSPGVYMKKASIGTLDAGSITTGTLRAISLSAGSGPDFFVNGSTGVMVAYNPILNCVTVGNSNSFGTTPLIVAPNVGSPAIGATFTGRVSYAAKFTGGGSAAAVRIETSLSQPGLEVNGGGITVFGSSSDITTDGKIKGGGSTSTDAAVIGRGTGTLHGGRFHHGTTGNAGFIASGSASFVYDFYADGTGTNYGPFTGAHDALIPKGATAPEIGDIMVDVACLARANVSNTLFEVALSSIPNQKAAVGVAVRTPVAWSLDSTPAALKTWTSVAGEMVNAPSPEAEGLSASHDYLCVNAVGEGQINVCGEGGDIEAGDLIVTSSTPGKGMKQADDLVRGYTVAKAREAVTFADPSEVKQIACIYLAG